jgi:hypothetical protein
MPNGNRDWAKGYALQALSDLNVLEVLANANVEKCHRLHFLQMAAEKTCKAHLVHLNGRAQVKNSHGYVASTLPPLARHFYSNANKGLPISKWKMASIKKIALEIQLLAPASRDGDAREDNSEYPWEDASQNVQVPCLYSFPRIEETAKEVVLLIKLIRTAAETYAR